MGGNVRVGLEDSLWIGPGQLAKSNAEQVTLARQIIEALGLEVATPDEAREILQLKGGDKVAFCRSVPPKKRESPGQWSGASASQNWCGREELEPPRLAALTPQASASTNSATTASFGKAHSSSRAVSAEQARSETITNATEAPLSRWP